MGESLYGHLEGSVLVLFLQQLTHQLTTGLKTSYRFGPLVLPVAETAHLWHMQYCLGMLSNLVEVWEAQCPAVVPFPHIQHSAGIHFSKANTQQPSKWALQWDKEVFKWKEWGE